MLRSWFSGDRLLAAVFFLAAVAACWTWSQIPGFQRYSVALRNARNMPLRAVVFEPAAGRRPFPAIVVCQPVNSPPEAGMALILEFLRHGLLVVTFDFRGASPAENRVLLRENVLAITSLDAGTVLAYLAARPDVDRARIGLIGHSVGGTLALRAGIEQPWVRAVVAVGIAGEVTKHLPQNLLWLVGLYDEFRPLLEMRRVMEASNSEAVSEIERTTGDFAQRTARRLSVTGTADHFTEFLDPGTAQRALAWFESAFEGRAKAFPGEAGWRPGPPAGPLFYACYSLAFLTGWLLLLRRLRAMGDAGRLRPRVFSAVMAALLVGFVFVPLPRLSLFRADLVLWGLALLAAVNARARMGRAAWLIPLAWASFLATLVVNQAAYFWRHPYFLSSLPAFPFWHVTGLMNSLLFSYPRGLLFSRYAGAVLKPRWFLWAFLALEVIRPGFLLRGLWSVIQRARNRAEATAQSRQRNWTGWVLVLGLFAALAALLSMRAAQGFVDRESLLLAGWVILRFAVLPFFIFAFKPYLLGRRL